MTRLIDEDALIEAMTKFSNATGEDMTHGIFYAHIAPTIDAVPVIRCKDCVWFRDRNNETECVLWNYATTSKNAFCYYASRKQTGADYAGFAVYEAERPE